MKRPPKTLDASGRRKWAELLPILESRGNVDAAILNGLTAYCTAWAQWEAATAKVVELGPVVKSPAGFAVVSPYVAVAAQAERRLRQWATELKLTPKTRGRTAKASKEPDDEQGQAGGLLRLLGGGKAAG